MMIYNMLFINKHPTGFTRILIIRAKIIVKGLKSVNSNSTVSLCVQTIDSHSPLLNYMTLQ